MADTATFPLRGDQIGSYTLMSGSGNDGDRVVTLTGAQALGTADDVYTIEVSQTVGAEQFENGQIVSVYDGTGALVGGPVFVRPDEEQGFAAGDEHLVISDLNLVIDLAGLPATPTDITYDASDEAATVGVGDDDGELDFADRLDPAFAPAAAFTCIGAGARIDTPEGLRPVEALAPGDLVETLDHGPRPLIWVGRRRVAWGGSAPAPPPMRIAPGTLGPAILGGAAGGGAGCGGAAGGGAAGGVPARGGAAGGIPARPLILSPQHRALLRGGGLEALCGGPEALALAKGLGPLPGVSVAGGRGATRYVTLLLARHEVIRAEGVWVESLLPGPQALRMLGPRMARELRTALAAAGAAPRGWDGAAPPFAPARPLLRWREARDWAAGMAATGCGGARNGGPGDGGPGDGGPGVAPACAAAV
ncbi:Hint domain-containing protein [Rhodovulum sp. DZ06]|uniref:Hint domain-containing protein n=1 Tax=Rhodovulum sp. DZ06 TaxID=3425126 RepID=UPI003D32CB28